MATEIPRIEDSTLRELAAIVESHNRESQDQEVKLLRKKLEDLKWQLGMKVKTIKVRNASHAILTFKNDQVHRQCKAQTDAVDNELNQIKLYKIGCMKKTDEIKMHFRTSKEKWEKKEEKFIREIEGMNIIISNLHATLARHGIQNDQSIEESRSKSEEFEANYDQYLYHEEEFESDTEFGDYDDENLDPENELHYQQFPQCHQNMQYIQTIDEDSDDEEEYEENYEPSQYANKDTEDNQIESYTEEQDQQEEIEYSEQSADEINQDSQLNVQEADIEIEIEAENTNLSNELLHIDVSLTESPCEESRQTSSNSNIESEHKVLGSEELASTEAPTCKNQDEKYQHVSLSSDVDSEERMLKPEKSVKSIEPLRFSLDPFVHQYELAQREHFKYKLQKKAHQKHKLKSKFSSCMLLGRY